MFDRKTIAKGVASPPDDGHTGSTTTPEQTMVKHELELGPPPPLDRDPARVEDRSSYSPASIAIAMTILLLLLILLVFTPR